MEKPDDLSLPECWEFLAHQSVGRLALSIQALPAVLPVQYYLADRTFAICLGHFRAPDRIIDNSVVAFAVDSIDLVSMSGLSVQVQGTLSPLSPRGMRSDCGQPAAGQVVCLTPATISGHKLQLCPFLSM